MRLRIPSALSSLRQFGVIAAIIGAIGTGCSDESKTSPGRRVRLQADATPRPSALLAPPSERTQALAKALADVDPQELSADLLWALAKVKPQLTTGWLTQSLNAKGALPQLLIPDVREGVRHNELLRSLLSSSFGPLVLPFVLDDAELAKRVREEITGRVQKSTGATLPADKPLRFDGFSRIMDGSTDDDNNSVTAFRTVDQAARWIAFLQSPAPWQKDGVIGKGEYAFLLMRLLSEWKYAFGISSGDEPRYGGLTVRADGSDRELAAYDPREADDGARILSGRYNVEIPSTDALSLALNGGERWQRDELPVTLDEQTKLWMAGVQALSLLRPANRPDSASEAGRGFFGQDALLPDDAHQLALVFLPGMAALLDGRFIDRDARRIYGAIGDDTDAGPIELARLASTLAAWLVELRQLDDLNINQATRERIASGLPSLEDGLRLVVITLLTRYARVDAGDTLALVDTAGKDAEIAAGGEVLTALADVARAALSSSFLDDKLDRAYRWYFQRVAVDPASDALAAAWVLRSALAYNGADDEIVTVAGEWRDALEAKP